MADTWHTGNAAVDGIPRRGWIVGHFMDHGDVRTSNDVEIKWGIHPKGEQRPEPSTDEHRTTFVILIRGRFRIDLSVESCVLTNEGDYVMWGPGIDHTWHAEEDSTVLTVRWPSRTE